MHTSIHANEHTCIRTHAKSRNPHTCIHICMYTYAYMHGYIRTYLHTLHACIHTQTLRTPTIKFDSRRPFHKRKIPRRIQYLDFVKILLEPLTRHKRPYRRHSYAAPLCVRHAEFKYGGDVEGSRGPFLLHREKHKYRPYETRNIFKYSVRRCTYHFNTAERGGKGIGEDKQHLNTRQARQTVS